MTEIPPPDAARAACPMPSSNPKLAKRALRLYRWILDAIVTALVIVMIFTLLGALAGIILDFATAVGLFRAALVDHKPPHGVIYASDRELVIDVLSVFVLIELFRTFTDYLEFHRVRLRVLSEVGIAFILREIFIGLYDHTVDWPQILALAALLAVLVSARIASVRFPTPGDSSE